jgi:hypothetical protein
MKVVHRATVPNLQRAASGAARRLDEIRNQLHAEIAANTVIDPDKKLFWSNSTKKPATVIYPTEAVEKIIWQLAELQLELQWWSTPVDQRSKLPKPFSLR